VCGGAVGRERRGGEVVTFACLERESEMPYTSAILGCGPRAAAHIEAYEGLSEIELVAACDRDRARLDDYGERFGIGALYEDFEEMLAQEQPDIVHIVTPPTIREEVIEPAARHGVRAVAVEKPIALDIPQAQRIKRIADETGIKIAVNTQRRYFKKCRDLKKVLMDGKIGDIRFIRCVTKGNILSMGPHMVDLVIFFLGDAAPTEVWATAYGMNGFDYGHPAPANMLIAFTFPGDVVVYCEDSEDAVGYPEEAEFWQHLEFDIWGTKGRAWWIQNHQWGYQSDGMAATFVEGTSWDAADIPAQRAFTRAIAHWLDDDANAHACRLENALAGFDAIMGAFESARLGRRLDLPREIPDDVVETLEKELLADCPDRTKKA